MSGQKLCLTAVSVLLASHPVYSLAQVPMLEEVVVTAQKRAESLLEVPVSVQAVTGETLANAGVQDFSDLVNISPSLSLQDNLSPFQKSIYIRGVGTTINSATVEPSVSTVLDGVVLSRQGQFFSDLADIERVEVLRGPQSTLFGKNAVAGVLSIVTKKPDFDEADSSVELGLDEYGEVRAKATHGNTASDTVAYRIGANYKYVDENHIENVNSDGTDLDGEKSWGLRGKVLWDVSSTLEALFIADYTDTDAPANARVFRSAEAQILPALWVGGTENFDVGEDNRKVNINDPNENQIQDWGLSAELNWSLENHTVTSITAYRSWELEDDLDIDSLGFDEPLLSMQGVGTPAFRGLVSGPREAEQWSEELRLQSETSSDLQYVLGAFLWGTKYSQDIGQRRSACFDFGSTLPVYTPCADVPPGGALQGSQSARHVSRVDTEYYALFGQADYLVSDAITATFGVRWQRDVFEWDADHLGVLQEGDLVLDRYEGDGRVTNNELTGKAALQYMFDDDSAAYLSYARGYKGPGADLNVDFTDPLEPETVDSYELGYKTRLLEGRLSVNSAVFWQEFENAQVSFFDAEEVAFAPANAGESRQRGVEVEAQFAATTNLLLTANIAYLDAEYEEYTTACYLGDTDPQCTVGGDKDVAGETMVFAPEWKTVFSGRYYQPLGDTGIEGFIQANYRWQSDVQYDANQNPLTEQDAFGVVDLSLGVEDTAGRYTITLYVRNLTDENYVTNMAAFTDATGQSEAVIQFVPKTADRYFGASFKYSFR